MFSVLINGDPTFTALALQSLNTLHKYLNSMTSQKMSIYLINSNEFVNVTHIHSGHYFAFEKGLECGQALIQRYKAGQKDFVIESKNLGDLSRCMTSEIFVISQSEMVEKLRLIRPQLRLNTYSFNSIKYIYLEPQSIIFSEPQEAKFNAKKLEPDLWAIYLSATVKLILNSIEDRSNESSFDIMMPF